MRQWEWMSRSGFRRTEAGLGEVYSAVEYGSTEAIKYLSVKYSRNI